MNLPSGKRVGKPGLGKMAGDPVGTATALSTFARCVFEPEDIVEVRRLPSRKSSWCTAGELPSQAAELLEANNNGENLYVGLNPRREVGGRSAQGVRFGRCLLADFDGTNVERALKQWEGAGLPEPTLAVDSGHGAHVYLRLQKPVEDLGRWRRFQKALIAAVGSDSKVHDPPRVIRLPGFLNHKPPASKCRIAQANPDARYDPLDLAPLLHLPSPVSSLDRSTSLSSRTKTQHNTICVPYCVPSWAEEPISQALPTGGGQRNRKLFQLAQALKQIKPDCKPDTLRRIVKEWHRLALPTIRTKPFDPSWEDFIAAWRWAGDHKGIGLEAILDEIKDAPLPDAALRYDTPPMKTLTALCAALQRAWGDQPFFLSARAVADAVGVPRMKAWRMLETLLFDSVIERVTKGNYRDRMATQYRFKG